MATGTYAPWIPQQFFDNNGDPLASGSVETFIAGTSTHSPTYSDINLTIQNGNPLALNSAGYPTSGAIFLVPGQSYKFIRRDSTGSQIQPSYDNIAAIPASSANVDLTGTAGETLTAGQAVYLSDGTGGKTAGSWYKADSANTYSSTLPEAGMVPATITSGSTGTIRIAGAMTGLSSLTIGAEYFVGTAGALTSSAPTNKRHLGHADSTSSLVLTADPTMPTVTINNAVCQGRLTLTAATPITTADVTAATTLRFTPYNGNLIALYDGSASWSLYTFSELTIAVPGTTSQMYDVFIYDNSGTRTLELLAWTNDTTRATALVQQDGVLVKTGVTTRRYVGSFRTTAVSGQTEDSFAKRYVWNYANRVRRPMRVTETATTYNYTTDTYRQANANTANQLDCVIGVAEVLLSARVAALFSSGSADQFAIVSIGEDSTTTAITGVIGQGGGSTATGTGAAAPVQTTATLERYPAIGRHFYPWLERAGGGGVVAWYGTNSNAAKWQGGISGVIDG